VDYKRLIEDYGELLSDFEISPFESIDGLHIRDRLEEQYVELSEEEKELLQKYDLRLFLQSAEVYEHLKRAFNFDGNKPSPEWWWRLNEFGRIDVKALAEFVTKKKHFDDAI
jgi:5-bromo-4-chloroindolyl phosphate hydrolysis protein